MDTYSMFDGSFYKHYTYNNVPTLRLTISGDRVIDLDYIICPYGIKLERRLYGWADTVASSTITLSCELSKWEPERQSGIKRTINIDRYTGELQIEEFGYSINNDNMDYPFTLFKLYGHCELAKLKF